MMRLCNVTPARIDYYLDITATETNTPYFERDGYWLGELATTFGLSGPALRASVVQLATGRHPTTGNILSPHQRRTRFCAIDATFAAPKTISLLAAVGEPEITARIVGAHRAATAETVGFIERNVLTIRRRVDGARHTFRPQGGCIAAFEHRTSRASDPHLHTHGLIFNLGTPDGSRWSAIDSRTLYVHAGLLGALYRSSLRRNLSLRLDLSWHQIKPGWFDLGGLSPTMVQAFSQRQRLILADMQAGHHASARSREVARLRTRADREIATSYDELCTRWREAGFRAGISKGRLGELAQVASNREQVIEGQIADRVVAIAREHGDGVAMAQLLRAVADGIPDGVGIVELERSIATLVATGSIGPPADLWPNGPRGAWRQGHEFTHLRQREKQAEAYGVNRERYRSRSATSVLTYGR